MAGRIREEFAFHDLLDFELQAADYTAAAVCEVDVLLHFGQLSKAGRMRWIREGVDGMVAIPGAEGEWYLYLWGPWAIFDRAQTPAAPD